jgi:hypothetical protein
MKGTLEKIGDKWFVRYVRSEGGGSFRLPLHPNFVEMTDFVYIKNERFYDGDEIDFTEALVNPMGRDVDPNDLGQNHSLCKWYARPSLGDKEEQKQHLIDIMKGDEELDLYDDNFDSALNSFKKTLNKKYDESREIKFEDVFNDEKREGVKRVIHQHKVLNGLSLVNPLHLRMTDNGHGEFPDGYKLTEKGIQYIIEQLNREQDGK